MQVDNGISDAPQDQFSDEVVEVQTDDTSSAGDGSVKYDTYRRTLSEAKKYKTKVEEIQSQLTQLQQEKLSAEGKKDELIENLRKQNSELNGKLTKAVGSFAKSKVYETMLSEAAKLGCQDPDLVLKAYSAELDGIDFDDSFNPDREQIRATLSKVREERPYLFSKDAPKIGSHQIKSTDGKKSAKKSIDKLTDEELMQAWAKGSL